ncbi:MAG: hypothetical protein HQK77_12350 [Desulfobacterales bacterium]|nr:hypothetical protein [Desulfobacterales bacterium]
MSNGQGKIMLISLMLWVVLWGCGGPPGYIDSLAPGDPDKVIGKYSGRPDQTGIVTVNVVGKGIAPENAISEAQAYLLAERAALSDGYRKLSEEITGIYVKAYMSMGQSTIDYDLIRTETESWLRGTRIINIKHGDNGITEAHMEVNIHHAPDYLISKSKMWPWNWPIMPWN